MCSRSAPLVLAALCASLLPAQSRPVLSGFVTATGTAQYQVNAVVVLCDPAATTERVKQDDRLVSNHDCPTRILGESISVFGKKDKISGTIHATAVERDQVRDIAVYGFALIDKVLVPLTGTTGTLRADGLPLTIVPETKLTFAQGSNLTAAAVGTNVWVRYTGTLHPNGTVTASSLLFSPNVIAPSEGKLRKNTEFDAAAIEQKEGQGSLSRAFLGPNGKHIPASHNRQRRTASSPSDANSSRCTSAISPTPTPQRSTPVPARRRTKDARYPL